MNIRVNTYYAFITIIFTVSLISICCHHFSFAQQPTNHDADDYHFYQQQYSTASTINSPYRLGEYLVKLGLTDFENNAKKNRQQENSVDQNDLALYNFQQTYEAHQLLIAKFDESLEKSDEEPGDDNNSGDRDMSSAPSYENQKFGRLCSSSNELEFNSPELADVLCKSVGFAYGQFWIRNSSSTSINHQQQTTSHHPILFKDLECDKNAGDLTQCRFKNATTGKPNSNNNNITSFSSSCTRTVALNCTYGQSRGYEFRLTPSWRVETRYFRSWAYTNVQARNSSSSSNSSPPSRLRKNLFKRICDDHWNKLNTMALCRTMNFMYPGNATFESESTATSSILYSRDDTTSIGMDNVFCSSYQYNPSVTGNNFDSCSFSSSTHNCLSRYESLVIDCIGNKDIKNTQRRLPSGGSGNSKWSTQYSIGVRKESLLVFVCGSLFLLCSFVCCYRMLIKKKLERQAAIQAVREGRLNSISNPIHQIALLEQAFGVNADSEERLLHHRRRRRLGRSNNNNDNNTNDGGQDDDEMMMLEHYFVNNQEVNDENDAEDENNNILLTATRNGGTFRVPHIRTASQGPLRRDNNNNNSNSPTRNGTTRPHRALSVAALSALLPSPAGSSPTVRRAILERTIRRTATPPVSSLSLSPLSARRSHHNPNIIPTAIPLIAEARIATPTMGTVTPRGGSSRPRSYSSPASIIDRSSHTRRNQFHDNDDDDDDEHGDDDDEEKEEFDDVGGEQNDDEDFVLPPRGYDSPSPTKVAGTEDNNDDQAEQQEVTHRNFALHIPSARISSNNRHNSSSDDEEEDVSGVDSILISTRRTTAPTHLRTQESTTVTPSAVTTTAAVNENSSDNDDERNHNTNSVQSGATAERLLEF